MTVSRSTVAERLVALLSDLIGIPSAFPPGDTAVVARYAADFLSQAGYRPDILGPADGRSNCVARIGHRGAGPSILFGSQADTAPPGEAGSWKTDPFRAVVRSGRVFGLGAGKAKGSMAVHLLLAAELARRGGPAHGEVVFAFVSDEESLGSQGMAFLREAVPLRPDMVVLGGTTENQIVTAEPGVLRGRITAFGRAAPAVRSMAGDSAILRMGRLLERLDLELVSRLSLRAQDGMQATLTIGTIRGGTSPGTVADRCVVEFDRRLLPSETAEEAFDEIRAVAADGDEPPGTVLVERLNDGHGFRTDGEAALVKAFREAILAHRNAPARLLTATGLTIGRHFAGDGVPVVGFGPGPLGRAASVDESVPVDQLVDAALIQLGVLERLVGFRSG